MKAVVIREVGGPEVLDLVDRPDPEPGPAEIRVAVRATALNRADLLQRRGFYPAPPDSPADIPGLEYAGEVEAVGSRVQGRAVGERVFGILGGGGYAQKVVVPERMAVPVPAHLSWEEAAAVPEVFITAHDALFTQAGLGLGETVLIHTVAGGVGTAAVQLAQRAGAFTIGTAGSPEKLARAKELGLDLGIDRTAGDFSKVVKEHTRGAGVQVILDTVGPGYWERNLASLARSGRLVLIGLLDMAPANLRADLLLNKRLKIFGSVLRSRPLEEKIAATQAFASAVLPLLERRAVKPIVDRVFELAEVRAAHEYMERNENVGKIILRTM
jgi:putative PIG3 family NAD(P)H quinone oxidoreductase